MIGSQGASYIIQWQRPDGSWVDEVLAVSLSAADDEFRRFVAPHVDPARWRIIHRAVTVVETEIRRGE